MAEFWRVKCKECGKESVVYSRPATEVTCKACGSPLLKPRGGKPEVLCEIVEVLK